MEVAAVLNRSVMVLVSPHVLQFTKTTYSSMDSESYAFFHLDQM